MSTYIKRDKILATLQYAAMFSAQHPSSVLKKLQQTIATARKVFRLGRPVEELFTYATSSQGDATIAPLFNIIGRCSPFFNAIYFACDHVVLAKQIGLVSDGDTAARAQNYSLLACSFTGACSDAHTFQSHVASAGLAASMCSAVHAYAAVKALTARRSGEDSEQVCFASYPSLSFAARIGREIHRSGGHCGVSPASTAHF